jgi:hypothetical protein
MTSSVVTAITHVLLNGRDFLSVDVWKLLENAARSTCRATMASRLHI